MQGILYSKSSAITNNQYVEYYKIDDARVSQASLYNILTDPGETTDLSSTLPNVHQSRTAAGN